MNAGELARRCPNLSITDSLGKAAEAVRQSGCSLLLVLDNGRVVGIVDEETLLSASINSKNSNCHTCVGDVMKPVSITVAADMPISQVAWLMQSNQFSAVPVLDEGASFRGILQRSDVVSTILRGYLPQRIGGMATPFGVYLTTGNHRGGVGDLALATTGICMALCIILARVIIIGGLYLTDAVLQTSLLSVYLTGLGEVPTLPWGGSWLGIVPSLEMLIFFTAMRMLPLTGYHGAEHQVVHAIERGEDLTVQSVSKMPLEHPRCGTNIAALLLLLLTISVSNIPPPFTVAFIAVILMFWRQAGMLLQRFFTVKRPNSKQLLNGLKAGEELLAKFRYKPFQSRTFLTYFWNIGLVQVLIGAGLTILLAHQIMRYFGFPSLF